MARSSKWKKAKEFLNRGDIYYAQGEYHKAIEEYTKAIELEPDYAEAYRYRGNAWARLGEFGRAIKDYRKAAYLESAEAYYNGGNALANKGEYDKAIQSYTRAIEFKPDYAEAYYNRGSAWYHLGEYDRALKDFGKAWSLRSKLPDKGALVALAALRAIRSSLEEGRPIIGLEEAIKTWLKRGLEVMDYMTGEERKSFKELRKALARAAPVARPRSPLGRPKVDVRKIVGCPLSIELPGMRPKPLEEGFQLQLSRPLYGGPEVPVIKAFIGSGGMAEVYLATLGGRKVAVKMPLTPRRWER